MNGFAFHHVGVAVQDMQAAVVEYKRLFAYELVSGPFDDPIQRVSVCFLSRGPGDTVIELVAPLGADSPLRSVLKKGGGTYHVCYQVQDLTGAINHLRSEDCFLISGPVAAVAFEMRPIAWLMTQTNLLVELLQG
jgi:methylmalonyl-CoA/ethylmalonyl-CoA epimerase